MPPVEFWHEWEIWKIAKYTNGDRIYKEEFLKLWFNSPITKEIYLNAPVYKYTIGPLRKMRELSHKVCILTAQPNKKTMWYTHQWLQWNKIPYDELHFVEYGNKHLVECDIYIDDSPYNISMIYAMSEITLNVGDDVKIYVMDRPWNKKIDFGGWDIDDILCIKRIKSLLEVVNEPKRI